VLREWDVEGRLPPNQADIGAFRILSIHGVPRTDPKDWRLRIFGEVEEEKALTYSDVLDLPRERVKADVHCVEGWSVLDTEWEGFSTRELKNVTEIKDSARFVVVYCADGYTTNLRLEDFFADDSLLAYMLNGKELSAEQGYPLRLVVPKLYFWKSAKWVNGIEFSATDRKGYWEQRGYHNHGDPWKEERFSD